MGHLWRYAVITSFADQFVRLLILDFGHFGRPILADAPYERNLLINNEIELGDLYISA